jgi:hypothetical protein
MYVQSILSLWIQKKRLFERNGLLVQIEPKFNDKTKNVATLFLSLVQLCGGT